MRLSIVMFTLLKVALILANNSFDISGKFILNISRNELQYDEKTVLILIESSSEL